MKTKKQSVNIINFIRGCEPREKIDLLEPVREQIRLLNTYNFAGTFLLQYDALIRPEFVDLLKSSCNEKTEFGVWLEIVQPQAEKAGINWHGRFPWDWHANTGFSVGYTLAERERLIDVLFEKFKEIFGFFPCSMGSWAIDAHSLKYASEKYGLDASCNCKDQWGTDGYTLWGAYYNQAYYPCKNNMFCPAQSRENQIDVPIFRMLGSDPIYQYDSGLDLNDGAADRQNVVTLEPVYTGEGGGGGVKAWVDWYFDEVFSGNCISFANTQVGQENSFGWESMKNGLEYQFKRLAELREQGVKIETLAESGKWFKSCFKLTPPTALTALSDWKSNENKSIWYNCKNYRINIFTNEKSFFIRDFYLFNEKYRERYFDKVCTEEVLQFDNLPVADGNRFSGNGIRAGIFFFADGSKLSFEELQYSENSESAFMTLTNTRCGEMKIELSPESITITAEKNHREFNIKEIKNEQCKEAPAFRAECNTAHFSHNGFAYKLKIACGRLQNEKSLAVESDNGKIKIIV